MLVTSITASHGYVSRNHEISTYRNPKNVLPMTLKLNEYLQYHRVIVYESVYNTLGKRETTWRPSNRADFKGYRTLGRGTLGRGTVGRRLQTRVVAY